MVSKERRNRKQTREKQYNACDVGTYREEAKKNEKTRTKEIQRATAKPKRERKKEKKQEDHLVCGLP
jgi:hypothetical protein